MSFFLFCILFSAQCPFSVCEIMSIDYFLSFVTLTKMSCSSIHLQILNRQRTYCFHLSLQHSTYFVSVKFFKPSFLIMDPRNVNYFFQILSENVHFDFHSLKTPRHSYDQGSSTTLQKNVSFASSFFFIFDVIAQHSLPHRRTAIRESFSTYFFCF